MRRRTAGIRLRAATATALACLTASIGVPAVRAAEPATVIVVFDGSGSMWGRLPGERDPKFATARVALREALGKMPAETRVGLAAFGHRRKADCSDTEVMLAPEPRNVERIVEPLEKFNPKGKGPLVAAMKMAAASLAKVTGPASLVVVHDDPDNCNQDPCAAADEIAKATPGLAVHIVSIALAKPDAQRLACVARATGGRQFEATDAATLTAAVAEAIKLASSDSGRPATAATPTVEAPKPAIAPAAAAPPDDGPSGLKLAATLGSGGPSVVVPLTWRVRNAAGPATAPPVATVRTANFDMALPAGAYVVDVAHGTVTASATFEVKAKGRTQGAIALQAGAIRVSAVLQKGMAALEQAVFTISAHGSSAGAPPVWSGGADAPPVILPAGSWRVTAEVDRARTERDVVVKPGALVDEVITLGAGRLQVKAVDREGAAPFDRVVFQITEDDADSPGGRREIARSAASEPEFTLPAGTYYLTARHGASELRERVLINAGDNVTRALVMPIGFVAVQSRLAGTPVPLATGVAYRIERLDVRQDAIRVSKPAARIELPAGRYRVESEVGVQSLRVAREIEIKPGAQANLAFEHMAAQVTLKLAPGRAVPTDLAWDVRDDKGRVVWQSPQAEPRALLAPGRYKARVESRDRRAEIDIEIKGGESRVIEVPLD